MSDDDWERNLWSAANGITAFAAAQGLGFGYILGKGDISKRITTKQSRVFIIAISLLAMSLYCLAVFRIGCRGSDLDHRHPGLWTEMTVGRIIAIVFFTLLPLPGLFDARLANQPLE